MLVTETVSPEVTVVLVQLLVVLDSKPSWNVVVVGGGVLVGVGVAVGVGAGVLEGGGVVEVPDCGEVTVGKCSPND